MRAQYLSNDRPETQVECREQSSNLDEMGLKRLARFLGSRPTLLVVQVAEACHAKAWCDTDHSGSIRTRKGVAVR